MNMSTQIGLQTLEPALLGKNRFYLDRFLLELQTATSKEQVWAAITEQAASVGFEFVTYVEKRSCLASDQAFAFSNLPDWWCNIYLSEGLISEDIIFNHCYSLKPKLVEIYQDDPDFAFDPIEKERRSSMFEAGFRYGFISPNSLETDACISGWCFGCASDNADFIARYARFAGILRVMGFCAYERLKTIMRDEAQSNAANRALSCREVECLTHLACGKRSPKIAQLMGISLSTVEFHIKGIKKKLGAATREEAVAKAITQGEISYRA